MYVLDDSVPKSITFWHKLYFCLEFLWKTRNCSLKDGGGGVLQENDTRRVTFFFLLIVDCRRL